MTGILITADVCKVTRFSNCAFYPMQFRLRIILHEGQLSQKYSHDL